MAHTKSAIKRLKQSKKANLKNRSCDSAFVTTEKKFRVAIAANNREQANELLNLCFKRLDKNANDHVYHKNKTDRKKSQLKKLFSSLEAAKA